ncbi:TetR/AcrR family transcriptional regulator [uncultured Pseudodesulfovibrio sp.]|uniref:TetR/AcrR family transcriptional regulator n=1 Tax=uncultured Pseudodesulfovibrio sp. TaxID=2035858 RepID=UPI0029C635C2|nr:TetR/AcrR family transcriptional regulator [uncultured Pseudodesulfovibrio sp.]
MSQQKKDREQTRQRIVDAVGRVLAEGGFKKLGVNRIAREAGVDKVLIYRYFGGLPELVTEYGRSFEYWPQPEEMVPMSEEFEKGNAHESLRIFFRNYVRAIRKRPMTLEIMAWEMTVHDDMAARLEDVRMRTVLECFERMELAGADTCDLTTGILVLFAAVNSLLVKSRNTGTVGGLDLHEDGAWDRIDAMISVMAQGLFRCMPDNQEVA